MDDDSCKLELIEIVPVDDYRNCPESPDVKLSPCHVKVCIYYYLNIIDDFRNVSVTEVGVAGWAF